MWTRSLMIHSTCHYNNHNVYFKTTKICNITSWTPIHRPKLYYLCPLIVHSWKTIYKSFLTHNQVDNDLPELRITWAKPRLSKDVCIIKQYTLFIFFTANCNNNVYLQYVILNASQLSSTQIKTDLNNNTKIIYSSPRPYVYMISTSHLFFYEERRASRNYTTCINRKCIIDALALLIITTLRIQSWYCMALYIHVITSSSNRIGSSSFQ